MMRELELSRMRWDGIHHGFYENYFIKLVDVSQKFGFWIRYTLISPVEGSGNPDGTVWAIFFDTDNPEQNIAIKRSYPAKSLESGRGDVVFQLGHNLLTLEGCRGEVNKDADVISWNLIFDRPGLSLNTGPIRNAGKTGMGAVAEPITA